MHKNLLFYFMGSVVVSLFPFLTWAGSQPDEWKINGRLRSQLEIVDVHANPGGSTSRHGTTHNEELSLRYNGPLKKGLAGVETRMRYTNRQNIQSDDAQLLYLRSYYRDKIWRLEAGDVAASYNSYVYGGSAKGMKMDYKSSLKHHTWNYSAIAGLKNYTWTEAYKTEEDELSESYTAAFQAEYIYKRAKTMSFSCSVEDVNSRSGSDTIRKKGMGFGFNGRWRFNKSATLKWRSALTHGSDDVQAKADDRNDAVYLKLMTKPLLKSVRSDFTFQRVDPDFVSFGGSANSDTMRFENSTQWRISSEYLTKINLKSSQDNLDDALGDTRHIYYGNLSFNVTPKALKRTTLDFNLSNKRTTGRGSENRRSVFGTDFTRRNKQGLRYGGGFQFTEYKDNVTASSSQHTSTIRALIGYRKTLGKVSYLSINLRPDYQRTHGQLKKLGLNVNGAYSPNKRFSMDLSYRLNNQDKTDANDTRHSVYQLRGTYKLDKKGRNLVRLLVERRNTDTDNDSANSYFENIAKLTFEYNF